MEKPALLRRVLELGLLYSGQVLSYTKMLGQLQDAGNTVTLAYYLELLEGAGLLGALQKYAAEPIRRRARLQSSWPLTRDSSRPSWGSPQRRCGRTPPSWGGS